MPKNMAQWTGVAITAIVVLGSDLDVMLAVPLGILAGAVVTFIASFGRQS